MNSRLSHLSQVRVQVPWYVHPGGVTQGHTELGQQLGSEGGFGGGAAVLAVESLTPNGRWTVRWMRLMRAELREADNHSLPTPAKADVMHSIGVERVVVLPRIELTGGVNGVLELNRDFQRDVFNVNLVLGVKAHW
jgi:hypothetical protein